MVQCVVVWCDIVGVMWCGMVQRGLSTVMLDSMVLRIVISLKIIIFRFSNSYLFWFRCQTIALCFLNLFRPLSKSCMFIYGLTVVSLTVGSLTVGFLTVGSLTVGSLTVGSLTVGSLTVGSLSVSVFNSVYLCLAFQMILKV